MEFPGNVKDLILHHHERFNGSGYPDHVNGGQLSIESCILAVADAYDAMTSDRPYRKALPKEKAVSILIEEKAIQFHPAVVDSFLRVLQEK
mgnify:CR=1 FL=1